MERISPLAKAHQRLIDRDPRNPSRDPSAPFELAGVRIRLQQRFLLNVFGVFFGPRYAKSETEGASSGIVEIAFRNRVRGNAGGNEFTSRARFDGGVSMKRGYFPTT
ncbi:MAG: hypothetical protein WA734_12590 [Candidatus Acidiferrales bacterium]